ncbi:hypothetical protein LTR42_002169 [Elasticomyces elasticus]|nr:hypothetical protein LTR42_002169 [Elasticomyces elasticus]
MSANATIEERLLGWPRNITPQPYAYAVINNSTPSALRLKIEDARSKDEELIEIGGTYYKLDDFEATLAHCEAVLSTLQIGQLLRHTPMPPTTTTGSDIANCQENGDQEMATQESFDEHSGLKRKLSDSPFSADSGFAEDQEGRDSKRQKPASEGSPVEEDTGASVAQPEFLPGSGKLGGNVAAVGDLAASGYKSESREERGVQSTMQKHMHAMVGDDFAGNDVDVSALESKDEHDRGQDRSQAVQHSNGLRPIRSSTTFTNEQPNYITDVQENEMKALTQGKPRYLWRVQSNGKPGYVHGTTSQQEILPAAWVRGKKCYTSIFDFPTLSELVSNLGDRALSYHKEGDQFTSYTTSPLFALVHAQALTLKGERYITITFIDTWAAKNSAGKPAEFYHLPTLQEIIGTAEWRGWTPREANSLKSPQFSHEYVAHGVLDLRTNPFQPVPFGRFLSIGLYDHVPSFFDEKNPEEMLKLYHRCLQIRVLSYHSAKPTPFDSAYLNRAADLARLFCREPSSAAASNISVNEASEERPINLHIFLDLVGLTKREKNDAMFIAYIKEHFEGREVDRIMHQGMNRIQNNLPELLQVMDRIRETCNALGSVEPAPNVLDRADKTRFDADGGWKGNWDNITGPAKENSRVPDEHDTLAFRAQDVVRKVLLQHTWQESFQKVQDARLGSPQTAVKQLWRKSIHSRGWTKALEEMLTDDNEQAQVADVQVTAQVVFLPVSVHDEELRYNRPSIDFSDGSFGFREEPSYYRSGSLECECDPEEYTTAANATALRGLPAQGDGLASIRW